MDNQTDCNSRIKTLLTWLLKQRPEVPVAKKIWSIGLLTGWRRLEGGAFGPVNFERGLLLYRLVEVLRPNRILEVGTGRGFGCIVMAQCAKDNDLSVTIDTIDVVGQKVSQSWPIRVQDKDTIEEQSRNDVWVSHFESDLIEKLVTITGDSVSVLREYLKRGAQYDFIFIDAGHDPYHAVADLSYGIAMLRPGGYVLVDDFAPQAEYGLGAIMAYPHVKKYFSKVVNVATNGLVWPTGRQSDYGHGMMLLADRIAGEFKVDHKRLVWWKLASRVMQLSYAGRRAFPIVGS